MDRVLRAEVGDAEWGIRGIRIRLVPASSVVIFMMGIDGPGSDFPEGGLGQSTGLDVRVEFLQQTKGAVPDGFPELWVKHRKWSATDFIP